MPVHLPSLHHIARQSLVHCSAARPHIIASLGDQNPVQVATILHRLEQAKYWSGLKQRHNSQVLATKQRSAIEGQMADCMRSTEAPPAAELVAMVQAGCEEEVCLFIVSVCLQGFQSCQRHTASLTFVTPIQLLCMHGVTLFMQ